MKRLAVFDLDGTLVDSRASIDMAVRDAWTSLDLAPPGERAQFALVREIAWRPRAVEHPDVAVSQVQRVVEHGAKRRDAGAAGNEDEALLGGMIGEGEPTDGAVDTDERARFEREFGLRQGELAVGMLAQFIERKGHRVLIEALPSVLRRAPDTRMLLFGQGPLVEDMRRLCAQRGLNERVLFAGFRNDMEKILPCLDLVVHPALMEGLGVSLLEAAACAVPIIASNAGGMPEIVRDRSNGRLVAPGDSGALAAAMIELLTDAALRQRCGAQGRRLVEAEFSVLAMVAGNYGVYQEVLGAVGTDSATNSAASSAAKARL